jgi:hypothetical protein
MVKLLDTELVGNRGVKLGVEAKLSGGVNNIDVCVLIP